MSAPKLEKKILPRWVWKIAYSLGIHIEQPIYLERVLENLPEVKTPIQVVVSVATKEELEQLFNKVDSEVRKRLQTSLEKEHTCYIAKAKDDIAAYSWINKETREIDFKKVDNLPKTKAFSYNSFVFPEYRRNKIFQKITEIECRTLKNEGYTHLCNFVSPKNSASIKGKENLGYRMSKVTIIFNPIKPIVFGKLGE